MRPEAAGKIVIFFIFHQKLKRCVQGMDFSGVAQIKHTFPDYAPPASIPGTRRTNSGK